MCTYLHICIFIESMRIVILYINKFVCTNTKYFSHIGSAILFRTGFFHDFFIFLNLKGKRWQPCGPWKENGGCPDTEIPQWNLE